jgi:hypothetical protein
MKDQKEIDAMIFTGSRAVWDVLNRPKNLEKEPFSDDLSILLVGAIGEMNELSKEIFQDKIDYEKTMYEAADACAFLFAIIAECRKHL